EKIDSLINCSDCYVSLHHAEGFGLGPAEAMAMGKVALLTNWSGNTEYMSSDNCVPVRYTLKTLGRDYGPYEAHQYWAVPDLRSEKIDSLINCSDCYVSLHHAEGFGLGPAEAMAMGKVALLTNWSGNTEYMSSDNCVPVRYTLKTLGRDYGPYEAHQYWAVPDL